MRCTRRLPDQRSTEALVVAVVLLSCGAIASCSSDDAEPRGDAAADADASSDAPGGDPPDAAAPIRDAGPVDAAPLPIACASASCATSLVTTLAGDRGEGFCALLHDRTVACWGANAFGQLGRGEEAGTLDGSSTPARVSGLTDVVDLDHTCAVDQRGATWCWGTGPFLRDATNMASTERTPVKLPIPQATRVGLGTSVACAAVADGVLCWGSNTNGQIGPFDTTPRYAWHAPRPVAIPPGAPVRQLAVGDATFILREDGSIVSLGANPPLGRASSMFPDPYAVPLTLGGAFAIEIVANNACATAAGTGYCWGAAVPKQTDGDRNLSRALPNPVVVPEPVVQIATTRSLFRENGYRDLAPYRWCVATISGDVYCWGFNESGQAGNGKKDYVFDAVRASGLPERAVQVRATQNTTCALLTDGTIYCWGSNFDGQLGNGKVKGVSLAPERVVLP